MTEHMQGRAARRIVLLDLDGTLTKSAPGIIASAVKTFEDMGLEVPDAAALQRFVGPAMIESMRLNHVPPDRLEESVATYRHYYSGVKTFDDPHNPGHLVPGCFYSSVFEGIPAQLARLRSDGYELFIATCKPEFQAFPVSEHFHLDTMIDGLFGASTDNSRISKEAVINYAFDTLDYAPERGDKAVMVGDRWTDVDGAHACGLDCLGCRWGYAEAGELEQHGACSIVEHIDDLHDAIVDYFDK